MSWLHLLFGFGGFAVELPEDLTERDQRDDREEQLRNQLRIGDAVGREEAVEQNEQRICSTTLRSRANSSARPPMPQALKTLLTIRMSMAKNGRPRLRPRR